MLVKIYNSQFYETNVYMVKRKNVEVHKQLMKKIDYESIQLFGAWVPETFNYQTINGSIIKPISLFYLQIIIMLFILTIK